MKICSGVLIVKQGVIGDDKDGMVPYHPCVSLLKDKGGVAPYCQTGGNKGDKDFVVPYL